jgi:hypothetical protein
VIYFQFFVVFPFSINNQIIHPIYLSTHTHIYTYLVFASKSSPITHQTKEQHHDQHNYHSIYRTHHTNHLTQHPHQPHETMPAVPKSYLPTFAAFLVGGITLTAMGASKEGATIDGARTRWQHQHASAQRVLSGGALPASQGS